MNKQDTDLLRLADAAQEFGLALSTLRKWVWARRVPSYRIGRRVLVRRRDMERLLEYTPQIQ